MSKKSSVRIGDRVLVGGVKSEAVVSDINGRYAWVKYGLSHAVRVLLSDVKPVSTERGSHQ